MPNASRAMASFSSASACLFLRNLAEKAFWIFSATVLAAEHARSSSNPGREEAGVGSLGLGLGWAAGVGWGAEGGGRARGRTEGGVGGRGGRREGEEHAERGDGAGRHCRYRRRAGGTPAAGWCNAQSNGA